MRVEEQEEELRVEEQEELLRVEEDEEEELALSQCCASSPPHRCLN